MNYPTMKRIIKPGELEEDPYAKGTWMSFNPIEFKLLLVNSRNVDVPEDKLINLSYIIIN